MDPTTANLKKKKPDTLCPLEMWAFTWLSADDKSPLRSSDRHRFHILKANSHTLTVTSNEGAGDTRFLSADSSLHISRSAVWPSHPVRKSRRPPPQPPSTTPTALRKVPYKGVGNIAWVLHHHNKKKGKRKHPVRIQNLDGFSNFCLVCLNALTHQPACGIWRIFSLKKKTTKKQHFLEGKKPFMVVNKSEG